jgi:hypothetical protein
MCSFEAARPKCSSSASTTKYRNWRTSTPKRCHLCRLRSLPTLLALDDVRRATKAKTLASAGLLLKPSDGLEPSTPPYHEREEGVDSCGLRIAQGLGVSLVGGLRRVLQSRAALVRPAPD